MIPVYQTKFGGSDVPEEEQGNCMSACIASVFELTLEDVPDFAGSINGGGWLYKFQVWLAERNLSVLFISSELEDIPPGYLIASVNSKTLSNPEDGHVIVINNGIPIHDPNPNTTSVYEKSDITDYWLFVVRDPSKCLNNE